MTAESRDRAEERAAYAVIILCLLAVVAEAIGAWIFNRGF